MLLVIVVFGGGGGKLGFFYWVGGVGCMGNLGKFGICWLGKFGSCWGFDFLGLVGRVFVFGGIDKLGIFVDFGLFGGDKCFFIGWVVFGSF